MERKKAARFSPKEVSKQFIDALNELLKLDPESVDILLSFRVQANRCVADHPHFVVTRRGKLGIMGILNGLLARVKSPKIAYKYNRRRIIGFTLYTPPKGKNNVEDNLVANHRTLDQDRKSVV